MKFEVLSSDLMSHLNAISRVLLSKNPMPVLDNFRFDIGEERLTVTASDGSTTMITSVPIHDVEGAGAFVVPAKTIMDPLKEMPQQQLTIEVDNGNYEVIVSYANGKYNFIGGNADEYPRVKPLEESALSFEINAQALLNGIQSTLFATAEDELRPVMNGIYFDIKSDRVIFVASDSKKLVRLINEVTAPGFDANFILPKKPANLLKNIIAKDQLLCTISFDSKSAHFQLGDYELICTLIEGRYPRYEVVIPKNNHNRLTIDRQLFLSALRRIAVFANSATNQVKFDLEASSLTISAQDVDYSTSGTETLVCSYDGTPMSIGFRANFLIEILSTITSQDIEMLLSDPARAGLVAPVQNNEGEQLLMLIMPMMLTDF
ncbi:MAG: DNA polymerase III subunit beta [Bacteroidales bacterium]|nr:DNA polymerase III subunit beta [Bacteroidales bacterium]